VAEIHVFWGFGHRKTEGEESFDFATRKVPKSIGIVHSGGQVVEIQEFGYWEIKEKES
jgi:hypothetical protein